MKIVECYIEGNSPLIKDNAELYATLPYEGAGSLVVYNSAILVYPHRLGQMQWFVTLISESNFGLYEAGKDTAGQSWSTFNVDNFQVNYSGVRSHPLKQTTSANYDKIFPYHYTNGVQSSVSDTYTFSGLGLPIFYDADEYISYISNPYVSAITSNGGGATHIAKVTGQLKNLSSNLSDVLIVSGGGGGGIIVGEDTYAGKDAGGVSGSGNNSGNQSTGYAFGQGESGEGYSGGGGGMYGGYKGGTS